MLQQAKDRGFSPEYVSFDSWYSSLENLKLIRDYGWIWLTRLKSNRLVNPDDTANQPLSKVEIAPQGTIVHLKGYCMVKIFKIVSRNGDTAHSFFPYRFFYFLSITDLHNKYNRLLPSRLIAILF